MSQECWANQAGSYSAEVTRRAVFASLARTAAGTPGIVAGGLVGASDLQLSAPGSGLSVNIGTGECVVGGNEGGTQGAYYGRNTASANLAITSNASGNPRIDTVVATIADAGYTQPVGVSGNGMVLQVVLGTATAGATLSNLLGIASPPGSSLVLGYVLVPSGASNIVTVDILNSAVPFSMGNVVLSGTDAGKPTAAAGNRGMFWYATDSNAFYYSDGTTWRTIYGARGVFNLATSQSVTSATYSTLATPDQVSNIVLPTNGVIEVFYQATWQESVAGAGRAAIFIGSNQTEITYGATGSPATIAAATGASSGGVNLPLFTTAAGLASMNAGGSYSGNVTTGQIVGAWAGSSNSIEQELNGSTVSAVTSPGGGPCYIFGLPAGTYTVSVRFKSSSGSVTASNRTLWAEALPAS